MFRHRAFIAAAIAASVPGIASAQAASCRIPAHFAMPRPEPVAADQVRRTPVTRYTLALSWSPQHCFQARGRDSDAMQCDGSAGRFGFILHGLWPETEGREWPQYCRPARQISRATLRRHLCMTPSAELLQHEWSRHGTCMSPTPERYFRAAAILYRAVRYPDMAALARETTLSVADFTRAFAGANPGLRENMISVQTTRAGWLEEVRICLDRRFRRTRCPDWSRGAPPQARLRISPLLAER
jgi:ribonuclease T2